MVILVMGLPGSGKSYFASRLAVAIGADYLSSDRIRKELMAERSYSVREKEKVYSEMLSRMNESVKKNKDLVLDATFYKQRFRDKVSSEISGSNKVAFIEVTAPGWAIKKRLSHEREFSEADFDVYKVIRKEWEPVLEKHLELNSVDNSIEDMLQKAIRYLHQIRNEQGTNQSIGTGGSNS
jgi:predicted kinase